MQCKRHRNICAKKYLKYKNICNKITEKTDRLNFITYNLCKNKTQKERKKIIKNINKCINGRIDYPVNCSNGCIIEPNNIKSLILAKKNDMEHYHEVVKLIKNKLKCK